MKLKNLTFIGLIFILLLSLSFIVLAQRDSTVAQQATVDIANSINKALDWVFGVSFVDWTAMLLTISIFLVLFIVFSDALINFSPLSRNAALGVGFLLTLIAALLKIPFTVATYALGITATFGVFAVAISLMVVFLSYVVLHIVIFRTLLPLFRKPENVTAEQVSAGIHFLKNIGRTAREEGRKKGKT